MKHILAFISAIIALLVVLSGCYSAEKASTESETKRNKSATVESENGDESSTAPVEIPTEQAKCVIEEDGTYYLTLPISGQKIEFMYGYERYVPYITDELVERAEKALNNKMSQYDNITSDFYLCDIQDYLCLSFEVIVHFESYNPDAPEGDHEHLFYDERITVCPFPKASDK